MIIGIAGKARSGKDTVANVLVKKFGFKKLNMADPLKEVCSEAFKLPIDYFYSDDLKDTEFSTELFLTGANIHDLITSLQERGIEITPDTELMLFELSMGKKVRTPRELMQYVGTELCRRCISDDIWIKMFVNHANKMQGNIVCADTRMPNERLAIRKAGGINILVKRSLLNTEDSHVSENSLGTEEEYQVIMNNDSSKSVFENDVELWYAHRTNFRLNRG